MATQHLPSTSATVGELAEVLPSLPAHATLAQLVDLCLAGDGNDWVVIVDDEQHPVRLIERAALLQGEPFEHRPLIIEDSTPVDVALRRFPVSDGPLVCCDAGGRYVGLVGAGQWPDSDRPAPRKPAEPRARG